jgi:predicted RNase H-like nuclease
MATGGGARPPEGLEVVAAEPIAVIAIDMPIGLPDNAPRQADLLARAAIGRLSSSVFTTPVRAALQAPTHAEAVLINRELTGQGLSIQAYGLRAKLFEVDEWLTRATTQVDERPARTTTRLDKPDGRATTRLDERLDRATTRLDERDGPAIARVGEPVSGAITRVGEPVGRAITRVVEVHPEVSFAYLAGAPLTVRKSTWAGAERRRALLADAGIPLCGDLGLAGYAVGVDDVLDAGAAAWSALRVAEGKALSFPDPPETFADGRPAAIWA